ncbi:MAG: hypothetical protein R3C08_13665 [Hyphomonas sp.]
MRSSITFMVQIRIQAYAHRLGVKIKQSTNPRVIKAYERRIAEAEHHKLVALESASHATSPPIPFESLIKLSLKYLSAPKALWDSWILGLRRLVLKLTFSGHIYSTKRAVLNSLN